MRRFAGLIIMLIVWMGITIGLNILFMIRTTPDMINAIVSACYMLFLLFIIPIGLPLHSRVLEVLLMLYALGIGVLAVTTFLKSNHFFVKSVGAFLLAPYRGLFYFENFIGMGTFAVYAMIGCFAAFLTLAAGVGACMVQPRE